MSAAKRRRRAVLYVRISKDRATETSTTTQLEALRAYCAANDVEIVSEHVERGRSAYVKGTKRPQLDAARAAIRTGAADTLIAWQLDRLARSTRELLTIVDELREHDASLVMTQQQIDTDGVMGQLLLTVLGAVAELESGIKSERMLAAAQHRRDVGRPVFARQFGYETTDDGDFVPVAAEADGVRTAFRMFVDGATKASIARTLNEAGLRSVRGNPLTVVAVRDILANPVYAAKRYDGKWTGRDDMHERELIDGAWEPLIDVELFDAAQQLVDSSRGSIAARVPGLLTSSAQCGKCGSTLLAKQHRRGRRYSCTGNGCWLSCDEAQLDELLLSTLVNVIDDATWNDLRAQRNGDDPAAAIEAELEQLAIRYADGELLDVEWNVLRPRLLERLDAARDRSNDCVVPDVDYPFARWDDLTIDQQRAVLAAVVDSVIVNEAASTRQRLVDRVEITPTV